MTSQLNHLVAREQNADMRRAAARDHLAAAAVNETRRERSIRLPSLRLNRSLQGIRKRFNIA
jgi:hypothetical protein